MKRKIHISECTCEHVVAEDIFNDYDKFLLPRGTAINRYLIQRLAELGIEYIWVTKIKRDDSIMEKNFYVFKEKFETIAENMERFVTGLVRGQRLDFELVQRMTKDILYSQHEPRDIIKWLLRIKSIDIQTYQHSINVSFYSMLLAGWLNLARKDILIATQAGLLHDLGKAKVPNDLLNKKGKLTEEEMEEVKRHTIYGYDLVKDNSNIRDSIKDVMLKHHEREDGSGYPLGLRGEQLDMYTKIVAVADVYDAMVSDRPYKKALTPFDAFEEFIVLCRGRLDTYVIDTLVYNLSRYYTGGGVMLSNGKAGNIVYVPPHCVWKPIIDTGAEFLDLSREEDIYIANMV